MEALCHNMADGLSGIAQHQFGDPHGIKRRAATASAFAVVIDTYSDATMDHSSPSAAVHPLLVAAGQFRTATDVSALWFLSPSAPQALGWAPRTARPTSGHSRALPLSLTSDIRSSQRWLSLANDRPSWMGRMLAVGPTAEATYTAGRISTTSSLQAAKR
jgi:hypothetical protein